MEVVIGKLFSPKGSLFISCNSWKICAHLCHLWLKCLFKVDARKTLKHMSMKRIEFIAATVGCSEALGWEIVQVHFDTMDAEFDEEDRKSPYLILSVNFEFSDDVQIDYHDGEDYGGDSLERIQLWRDRVLVFSGSGREFDVTFELSEDAFTELRHYLKEIVGSDRFQE